MPHKLQVMTNLVILEKGNEQMWEAGIQRNSGNSIKPSDTKKQTAGWTICTIPHLEEKWDHNSCGFL